MTRSELFDSSDLFEAKDIMLVLTHLNTLAKLAVTLPGYKGPGIANTRNAKNMLGVALLGKPFPHLGTRIDHESGAEVEIDETKKEEWTESEAELIDWANSILAVENPPLKINNVEGLRSGIKIITLLRLITGAKRGCL